MEDCFDCSACFEMEGVACYSILTVVAGLTPDTEYTIFLEDRHGNMFRQTVTTDSEGDFTLDLTAFDDGMFTSNSGCYTIIASLNPLLPEPELMVIGYSEYECAKVKFLDIE